MGFARQGYWSGVPLISPVISLEMINLKIVYITVLRIERLWENNMKKKKNTVRRWLMNETATTASKADRTELHYYVPLCRTAVREWVSGHRDACVQELPARPSACSLPSPCAGTASQAPSMLTSTSVCRDCQPGPQHAPSPSSPTFPSESAGERGVSSRHEVKKKWTPDFQRLSKDATWRLRFLTAQGLSLSHEQTKAGLSRCEAWAHSGAEQAPISPFLVSQLLSLTSFWF